MPIETRTVVPIAEQEKLPPGGEAEQILQKTDGADHNVEWTTLADLTLIFENALL